MCVSRRDCLHFSSQTEKDIASLTQQQFEAIARLKTQSKGASRVSSFLLLVLEGEGHKCKLLQLLLSGEGIAQSFQHPLIDPCSIWRKELKRLEMAQQWLNFLSYSPVLNQETSQQSAGFVTYHQFLLILFCFDLFLQCLFQFAILSELSKPGDAFSLGYGSRPNQSSSIFEDERFRLHLAPPR